MSASRSRLIRRILYVLVGLVIIAFVVTKFFSAPKVSNYVTTKAEKGQVAQSVALTGSTEPTSRYQLEFQRTGKVQQIFAKVGDAVHSGDVLATLEHSDLDYQLEAQKAALRIAQANLAKAYAGPRAEEIVMNQLKIELAQLDSESAFESQENLLAAAQRAVDSAQVALEDSLIDIQQAQDEFFYAQQYGLDTSAALKALDLAQNNHQKAQDVYEKAVMDYQRQQDDLNVGVNKSSTNIQLAEEQLNLLQAQPREVDIAPIQAQVDQAWQSVRLSEYQLAQATLKAPADGVVTSLSADPGENVSVTQPFIVLDSSYYHIKALVSEADIYKIQIGQTVIITFDAFEVSREFTGKVTQIAPAETIVQGVVYYEIKIQIDSQDPSIKSGMTANLTIKTQLKSDVLKIPLRAVQYEGNQAYVQVLSRDEKTQEEKVDRRNVTLGLQGDEEAEIVAGLTEGEEVVTFTKTP